jgi:hypothetical protein
MSNRSIDLPPSAHQIDPLIAYHWTCDEDHVHTIDCLYVWHYCRDVLGPNTVAPGEEFGWRPAGVGAHTLVQQEPLTITASVYWPECCGLHGFITEGKWVSV